MGRARMRLLQRTLRLLNHIEHGAVLARQVVSCLSENFVGDSEYDALVLCGGTSDVSVAGEDTPCTACLWRVTVVGFYEV